MSTKGLIVVAFFVPASLVCAQPSQSLMVMAGDDVTKVMPRTDRYRFAEFTDGQLYYPRGERSEVLRMNYNTLLGAMQFIDNKGDTMYIAEDSNIFKYIQVGEVLFYHDYELGYFEILTREDPIKLLAQTRWKVIRKDMVVNNGYTTTASMGRTEFTSRRSDVNTFVQNENTLYGRDKSFYLLAPKDQVLKATKAGLQKAYPSQRAKVKKYLKNHDFDYRSEQQLREILTYFNGLIDD